MIGLFPVENDRQLQIPIYVDYSIVIILQYKARVYSLLLLLFFCPFWVFAYELRSQNPIHQKKKKIESTKP